MEQTIVRPAGEPDLDSLCDLYFEFHEFHAQHLPDFLQSLAKPTQEDRRELHSEIKKILDGNQSTILVAEHSGRVIGFAEIHLRQPDLSDRAKTPITYAHLQSLAVSEPYRLKGIGKLLLKAAEDWAHAHGALELRLDAWEFSAGPLGFYQKSGYRTFRRSLVKKI